MEFGTRTLDVKVRSQGMTALLFCQSLNSRVSYVWTVRKSGVLLVAAVVVTVVVAAVVAAVAVAAFVAAAVATAAVVTAAAAVKVNPVDIALYHPHGS
jgi:Kef-type K+ transport system membrane component KefB